jgi:hypothetical protein
VDKANLTLCPTFDDSCCNALCKVFRLAHNIAEILQTPVGWIYQGMREKIDRV